MAPIDLTPDPRVAALVALRDLARKTRELAMAPEADLLKAGEFLDKAGIRFRDKERREKVLDAMLKFAEWKENPYADKFFTEAQKDMMLAGKCPICTKKIKGWKPVFGSFAPEWWETQRERSIDPATGHHRSCPRKDIELT